MDSSKKNNITSNSINDNNRIEISGKVCGEAKFSHRIYGEGFYTFNISVMRLSESEDIIPITVSERLLDSVEIKNGEKVSIKGQVRSYNNNDSTKNRLMISVFVREFDDDMADNRNMVVLNGYICRTPVYRTTPMGREITDMLIAVNRAYNKSDYIPCIVWGRNARYAGKLATGDNIIVSGRMQSRKYQKKTENGIDEKTAYEVSVSKIEKVEKSDNTEETEETEENEND
ncbi:MAG: single-stranded DNA-binding protein [Clostridia bacterium]|nr:single-stranded DNA-binding protein [Clostridia bacterium]MCI1998961.1 single-stranded DNA-binding protein [Clostridia bacterium]MCI2013711.1 single-stranded DNA-binding protein [Clostridia bacterium]